MVRWLGFDRGRRKRRRLLRCSDRRPQRQQPGGGGGPRVPLPGLRHRPLHSGRVERRLRPSRSSLWVLRGLGRGRERRRLRRCGLRRAPVRRRQRRRGPGVSLPRLCIRVVAVLHLECRRNPRRGAVRQLGQLGRRRKWRWLCRCHRGSSRLRGWGGRRGGDLPVLRVGLDPWGRRGLERRAEPGERIFRHLPLFCWGRKR